VLVNPGLGPDAHTVQSGVLEQFEDVVRRTLLVLQQGTNEARKTTASKNGRRKQVLSFNSLQHPEQCRDHFSGGCKRPKQCCGVQGLGV